MGMENYFMASSVVVLRLSNRPDRQDIIIPPKAIVKFKDKVKVVYEDGKHIGSANFRRHKNLILSDILVSSKMPSKNKALALIKKLYPAVCIRILEATEDTVTELEIVELTLTPWGNADENIAPLGPSVFILDRGGSVN